MLRLISETEGRAASTVKGRLRFLPSRRATFAVRWSPEWNFEGEEEAGRARVRLWAWELAPGWAGTAAGSPEGVKVRSSIESWRTWLRLVPVSVAVVSPA